MLVAPWPVAEQVARRLACRISDQVLAYIADEEATGREQAIYGLHYKGRKGNAFCVPPEVCSTLNQRWQPAYDVLRDWCEPEASQQRDTLEAQRAEAALLRAELLRTGQVAEQAIRELREREASRVARDLEKACTSDRCHTS
jgi:hypothetical protein